MRLPGLVLPTGLLLAEAAMPSSLSGDLPATPHGSPQGHIAKVAIAKTLLIYCLHSGGLRRPPVTRLWGGKHYNLHEDRVFSSPGGMPSSLVTFQLPYGMAG